MKKLFQKKWWIVAVAIVAIVIIVSVVASQKQPTKPSATQAATETVGETTGEATAPEQTEAIVDATEPSIERKMVQVEILNYEFSLSEYLAEKTFYREIEDTAKTDVEVYTILDNQEYTLFIIVFDSTEGDIVHMLGEAEEEKQPIAFVMSELPEGLPDENAAQFYIAQGVVNDIMDSIKAK